MGVSDGATANRSALSQSALTAMASKQLANRPTRPARYVRKGDTARLLQTFEYIGPNFLRRAAAVRYVRVDCSHDAPIRWTIILVSRCSYLSYDSSQCTTPRTCEGEPSQYRVPPEPISQT